MWLYPFLVAGAFSPGHLFSWEICDGEQVGEG